MWKDEEIRELCRKLRPVIGEKADKLWTLYLVEDEKGRRDMAIEIELVAEKYLRKDSLQEPILLEPPSVVDSAGLFLLGDVVYNDKVLHELSLGPEDFIKQIGIFSITGEGKTNTAMLLALQLLKFRIPFLVIDWKRSWRNLLTYKGTLPGHELPTGNPFSIDDIQTFTIGREAAPLLWNPFRPPPGADPVTWISTIAEVLEKSHMSGPGVAYYLTTIFSKLFRQLNAGDEATFYPNFSDGLRELQAIRAWERELKWKQTALRIMSSFTLGIAARTFNARDPVKLEQLLEKPVIFELDLEMPKQLRVFFSEIILRWIHLYRLNQGETDKIRHVAFLEEIHNLFPQTKFEKDAHSSLENVYREIRGFGQGLVSITQHPSLLPVYVLGNCHAQIYLGLQHENDIRAARQALFLDEKKQEYLNRLEVGEAIVKVKNRINPCLVKIPLVPLDKGEITDEELRKRQDFSGLSSPESAKRHDFPHFPAGDNNRTAESPESVPTAESVQGFLIDILKHPLSSLVKRYERLGLSMRKGNETKRKLVEEELIVPKTVVTRTTQMVLFELTGKGKAKLRDLGYRVDDEQEGVVHKYWKARVADYYRNRDYEVLVEESVNGRPDVIAMQGTKKAALEIETGSSDIIGNIEKNVKAGFQEIVCVATSKELEEKIRQEVRERSLASRVKVTSVFEFDVS